MKKICKNYLDNAQAYSTKTLLIITSIFAALGFVILTTYRTPMLRYSLIAALALLVLLKRRYIQNTVKNLINVKKNK